MSACLTIIGIGNPWRCDDSIGHLVAHDLLKSSLNDAKIHVTTGEAVEIMEFWQGKSNIILIDACKDGNPAGTITRREIQNADDYADDKGFSSHGLGLSHALSLSEALEELPETIILYTITGKNFGFGDQLSPKVKEAIPKLLVTIRNEIKAYSNQKVKAHA